MLKVTDLVRLLSKMNLYVIFQGVLVSSAISIISGIFKAKLATPSTITVV